MAPRDAAPPPTREDPKAARGRPVGAGTSYGAAALRLLDNGYEPLPVVPGTKRPALSRWTEVAIDEAAVTRWTHQYPDHGIGLRTGALVGIDIDVLDPDLAHQIDQLVRSRFGDTLMRVGLWPKRLLLYRTEQPFPKMSVRGIEVLGAGQQFVAFGVHPDTGAALSTGPTARRRSRSPSRTFPLSTRPRASSCWRRHRRCCPSPPASARAPGERSPPAVAPSPRSGTLTAASPTVVTAGSPGSRSMPSATPWRVASRWITATLATTVWERFAATSDLSRPRKGGVAPYTHADAARKVADKLRLLAEGRLAFPRASRRRGRIPGAHLVGGRGAASSSTGCFGDACGDIEAWHADPEDRESPCIGIRATVGLGKSLLARRHLTLLRDRLIAAGAPSRIAVFAPSHALAEEVAAGWRAARHAGGGPARIRGATSGAA